MHWIYGIVDVGHPLPEGLTGVLDAPVQLVERGRLAAATSDIPDVPPADDEQIGAHAGVLDELLWSADTAGAVAPMRFGVAAPDRRSVERNVLQRNQRHLHKVLDDVRGCVEFNLKATADDEALLAAAADAPELRRLTRRRDDGSLLSRVAMGEAIAETMRARAIGQGDEIATALTRHAKRVRLLPAPNPLVLNASFLVPRKRADEFLRAASDVARSHSPLHLRCAGPLPAYSFTDTR